MMIRNVLLLRACVLALWAITPAAIPATISSGENVTGQLTANGTAEYSFEAQAGNSVILRSGATNFVPRVQLYGPGLVLLGSAATSSTVNRDADLALTLTNSGTFLVRLDSLYPGGAGGYGLRLALAPGTFTVPAGDDGGELVSGGRHSGAIALGDLDLWSFVADAGDGLQLRCGAAGFVPHLRVYGPDGSLRLEAATSSTVNRDAAAAFQATNSGPYLAVVSSFYRNGNGEYELSFVRAPGAVAVAAADEGGPFTNAVTHAGTIKLGELDAWTFSAVTGQSVQVRMGTTGFVPRLDLYGPDGALLVTAYTSSTVNRDARLALQVTNSGAFTLVASSLYFNGAGDYLLSFARVPDEVVVLPGDDGGALTNGWMHEGNLEIGDFDSWTFAAQSGDGIELRVGSPDLAPVIDLYGPDGTLVGSAYTSSTVNRDAYLVATATNSGTFTAVISGLYANTSGFYILTLAASGSPMFATPGDSGGSLTNGFQYAGTNVLGDLDAWQFHGTVGDSNVFRIGTVGYTPRLRLYGPGGVLLRDVYASSTVNRTNFLTYVVTNEGPHTIVASSLYLNGSGTYSFKQSRVPPDLLMPSLVVLEEGTALSVPIHASDPDAPGNSLTFLLVSGPAGVTISSGGPTNAVLAWPTTEAQGPSTNVIAASVTDVVNGRPFTRTNSLTVIVNEVNTAPAIAGIPAQSAAEFTPFSLSVQATDADLPANPLTFALASAPAGMVIDPESGLIEWTPGEADGPGTNLVLVTVTDDNPWAVNERNLTVTNSFVLIVREVNTAPQLQPAARQEVDELTPFSFNVVATDADLPPNPLTFQVLTPPSGLSINPATGAMSWTPGEAQGPSTNLITVVVTDDSPHAEQPLLRATNTVEVVVREVNLPPVLADIEQQSVRYGALLSLSPVFEDPDLPANAVTFALVSGPTNLTADAASGAIAWVPSVSQLGSHEVILRVTDDGVPALSATNTFRVVVTGVEPRVAIQQLAGGLMQISIIGDTGLVYDLEHSADLAAWESLIRLNVPTSPYPYIDPGSVGPVRRYYRVRIAP